MSEAKQINPFRKEVEMDGRNVDRSKLKLIIYAFIILSLLEEFCIFYIQNRSEIQKLMEESLIRFICCILMLSLSKIIRKIFSEFCFYTMLLYFFSSVNERTKVMSLARNFFRSLK